MKDMIRGLVEKRQALYNEAKAFIDRADDRGLLAPAEEKRFQALNADIEAYDARIAELHKVNEANKNIEEYRSQYETYSPGSRSRRKAPGFIRSSTRGMSDHEAHLRDWMAGREGGDVIEFDFSELGDRAQRIVDGVQNSVTKVASGDDLVQTDFLANVYQNLIERSSLLANGATILTTDHGRSITVPKFVARGTAAIVGEGTAIAGTDPTFGSTTLDAWKAAQLINVSNEMLEDTEVDLEGALAFDLGRSLGEVAGPALITGNGTNTARGIITATAADVGTAVQGTANSLEVDNLIDLYYSVPTPYRERGRWLMQSGTMKQIRKFTDAASHYVTPPFADGLESLMGRPVIIDPNVAAVGSGALSVGFGDIGAYYVRLRNLQLARSRDHKFAEDMTSFRATLRFDGDLVDQTGAFKLADTD